MLEDELRRQRPQNVLRHLQVIEVDDGHGELLTDRLQHLAGADEPQAHQRMVQPLAGAVLLGARLFELLFLDQPPLKKNASYTHGIFIVPPRLGGDSINRHS